MSVSANSSNPMNFIIVISDSLRRDHVSAYGAQPERWASGGTWSMQTPNIDKLAAQGALFENYHLGSFPTVLNRREMLTGRSVFTYGEWEPFPDKETSMPEVLNAAGYKTMLIADTPHIFRSGYHYQRGFTGWDWIRGQESDEYRTNPDFIDPPFDLRKLRSTAQSYSQHTRNLNYARYESEYFAPTTFRRASEWLEMNATESPFCLIVDTFDPHEPWDPPQWYVDKFDPGADAQITFPTYDFWEEFLSADELRNAHARYCGEVSMVDRWFGHLMDTVDAMNLWSNTAVLFMSDHGYLFGEYGITGKSIMTHNKPASPLPLFPAISHIPMLGHIPGFTSAGDRISGFVQPQDILPTLIELGGAECPDGIHGHSFMPLLTGEAEDIRKASISSHSVVGMVAGRPATVRTHDWTLYMGAPVSAETPISITGYGGGTAVNVLRDDQVHIREERPIDLSLQPHLYDNQADPDHQVDLIDENPEIARELQGFLVEYLESVGTAEKYIAPRRIHRFG